MMADYLRKVVSDFPETIQERVATSEEYQLFTVRYNTVRKLLDK